MTTFIVLATTFLVLFILLLRLLQLLVNGPTTVFVPPWLSAPSLTVVARAATAAPLLATAPHRTDDDGGWNAMMATAVPLRRWQRLEHHQHLLAMLDNLEALRRAVKAAMDPAEQATSINDDDRQSRSIIFKKLRSLLQISEDESVPETSSSLLPSTIVTFLSHYHNETLAFVEHALLASPEAADLYQLAYVSAHAHRHEQYSQALTEVEQQEEELIGEGSHQPPGGLHGNDAFFDVEAGLDSLLKSFEVIEETMQNNNNSTGSIPHIGSTTTMVCNHTTGNSISSTNSVSSSNSDSGGSTNTTSCSTIRNASALEKDALSALFASIADGRGHHNVRAKPQQQLRQLLVSRSVEDLVRLSPTEQRMRARYETWFAAQNAKASVAASGKGSSPLVAEEEMFRELFTSISTSRGPSDPEEQEDNDPDPLDGALALDQVVATLGKGEQSSHDMEALEAIFESIREDPSSTARDDGDGEGDGKTQERRERYQAQRQFAMPLTGICPMVIATATTTTRKPSSDESEDDDTLRLRQDLRRDAVLTPDEFFQPDRQGRRGASGRLAFELHTCAAGDVLHIPLGPSSVVFDDGSSSTSLNNSEQQRDDALLLVRLFEVLALREAAMAALASHLHRVHTAYAIIQALDILQANGTVYTNGGGGSGGDNSTTVPVEAAVRIQTTTQTTGAAPVGITNNGSVYGARAAVSAVFDYIYAPSLNSSSAFSSSSNETRLWAASVLESVISGGESVKKVGGVSLFTTAYGSTRRRVAMPVANALNATSTPSSSGEWRFGWRRDVFLSVPCSAPIRAAQRLQSFDPTLASQGGAFAVSKRTSSDSEDEEEDDDLFAPQHHLFVDIVPKNAFVHAASDAVLLERVLIEQQRRNQQQQGGAFSLQGGDSISVSAPLSPVVFQDAIEILDAPSRQDKQDDSHHDDWSPPTAALMDQFILPVLHHSPHIRTLLGTYVQALEEESNNNNSSSSSDTSNLNKNRSTFANPVMLFKNNDRATTFPASSAIETALLEAFFATTLPFLPRRESDFAEPSEQDKKTHSSAADATSILLDDDFADISPEDSHSGDSHSGGGNGSPFGFMASTTSVTNGAARSRTVVAAAPTTFTAETVRSAAASVFPIMCDAAALNETTSCNNNASSLAANNVALMATRRSLRAQLTRTIALTDLLFGRYFYGSVQQAANLRRLLGMLAVTTTTSKKMNHDKNATANLTTSSAIADLPPEVTACWPGDDGKTSRGSVRSVADCFRHVSLGKIPRGIPRQLYSPPSLPTSQCDGCSCHTNDTKNNCTTTAPVAVAPPLSHFDVMLAYAAHVSPPATTSAATTSSTTATTHKISTLHHIVALSLDMLRQGGSTGRSEEQQPSPQQHQQQQQSIANVMAALLQVRGTFSSVESSSSSQPLHEEQLLCIPIRLLQDHALDVDGSSPLRPSFLRLDVPVNDNNSNSHVNTAAASALELDEKQLPQLFTVVFHHPILSVNSNASTTSIDPALTDSQAETLAATPEELVWLSNLLERCQSSPSYSSASTAPLSQGLPTAVLPLLPGHTASLSSMFGTLQSSRTTAPMVTTIITATPVTESATRVISGERRLRHYLQRQERKDAAEHARTPAATRPFLSDGLFDRFGFLTSNSPSPSSSMVDADLDQSRPAMSMHNHYAQDASSAAYTGIPISSTRSSGDDGGGALSTTRCALVRRRLARSVPSSSFASYYYSSFFEEEMNAIVTRIYNAATAATYNTTTLSNHSVFNTVQNLSKNISATIADVLLNIQSLKSEEDIAKMMMTMTNSGNTTGFTAMSSSQQQRIQFLETILRNATAHLEASMRDARPLLSDTNHSSANGSSSLSKYRSSVLAESPSPNQQEWQLHCQLPEKKDLGGGPPSSLWDTHWVFVRLVTHKTTTSKTGLGEAASTTAGRARGISPSLSSVSNLFTYPCRPAIVPALQQRLIRVQTASASSSRRYQHQLLVPVVVREKEGDDISGTTGKRKKGKDDLEQFSASIHALCGGVHTTSTTTPLATRAAASTSLPTADGLALRHTLTRILLDLDHLPNSINASSGTTNATLSAFEAFLGDFVARQSNDGDALKKLSSPLVQAVASTFCRELYTLERKVGDTFSRHAYQHLRGRSGSSSMKYASAPLTSALFSSATSQPFPGSSVFNATAHALVRSTLHHFISAFLPTTTLQSASSSPQRLRVTTESTYRPQPLPQQRGALSRARRFLVNSLRRHPSFVPRPSLSPPPFPDQALLIDQTVAPSLVIDPFYSPDYHHDLSMTVVVRPSGAVFGVSSNNTNNRRRRSDDAGTPISKAAASISSVLVLAGPPPTEKSTFHALTMWQRLFRRDAQFQTAPTTAVSRPVPSQEEDDEKGDQKHKKEFSMVALAPAVNVLSGVAVVSNMGLAAYYSFWRNQNLARYLFGQLSVVLWETIDMVVDCLPMFTGTKLGHHFHFLFPLKHISAATSTATTTASGGASRLSSGGYASLAALWESTTSTRQYRDASTNNNVFSSPDQSGLPLVQLQYLTLLMSHSQCAPPVDRAAVNSAPFLSFYFAPFAYLFSPSPSAFSVFPLYFYFFGGSESSSGISSTGASSSNASGEGDPQRYNEDQTVAGSTYTARNARFQRDVMVGRNPFITHLLALGTSTGRDDDTLLSPLSAPAPDHHSYAVISVAAAERIVRTGAHLQSSSSDSRGASPPTRTADFQSTTALSDMDATAILAAFWFVLFPIVLIVVVVAVPQCVVFLLWCFTSKPVLTRRVFAVLGWVLRFQHTTTEEAAASTTTTARKGGESIPQSSDTNNHRAVSGGDQHVTGNSIDYDLAPAKKYEKKNSRPSSNSTVTREMVAGSSETAAAVAAATRSTHAHHEEDKGSRATMQSRSSSSNTPTGLSAHIASFLNAHFDHHSADAAGEQEKEDEEKSRATTTVTSNTDTTTSTAMDQFDALAALVGTAIDEDFTNRFAIGELLLQLRRQQQQQQHQERRQRRHQEKKKKEEKAETKEHKRRGDKKEHHRQQKRGDGEGKKMKGKTSPHLTSVAHHGHQHSNNDVLLSSVASFNFSISLTPSPANNTNHHHHHSAAAATRNELFRHAVTTTNNTNNNDQHHHRDEAPLLVESLSLSSSSSSNPTPSNRKQNKKVNIASSTSKRNNGYFSTTVIEVPSSATLSPKASLRHPKPNAGKNSSVNNGVNDECEVENMSFLSLADSACSVSGPTGRGTGTGTAGAPIGRVPSTTGDADGGHTAEKREKRIDYHAGPDKNLPPSVAESSSATLLPNPSALFLASVAMVSSSSSANSSRSSRSSSSSSSTTSSSKRSSSSSSAAYSSASSASSVDALPLLYQMKELQHQGQPPHAAGGMLHKSPSLVLSQRLFSTGSIQELITPKGNDKQRRQQQDQKSTVQRQQQSLRNGGGSTEPMTQVTKRTNNFFPAPVAPLAHAQVASSPAVGNVGAAAPGPSPTRTLFANDKEHTADAAIKEERREKKKEEDGDKKKKKTRRSAVDDDYELFSLAMSTTGSIRQYHQQQRNSQQRQPPGLQRQPPRPGTVQPVGSGSSGNSSRSSSAGSSHGGVVAFSPATPRSRKGEEHRRRRRRADAAAVVDIQQTPPPRVGPPLFPADPSVSGTALAVATSTNQHRRKNGCDAPVGGDVGVPLFAASPAMARILSASASFSKRPALNTARGSGSDRHEVHTSHDTSFAALGQQHRHLLLSASLNSFSSSSRLGSSGTSPLQGGHHNHSSNSSSPTATLRASHGNNNQNLSFFRGMAAAAAAAASNTTSHLHHKRPADDDVSHFEALLHVQKEHHLRRFSHLKLRYLHVLQWSGLLRSYVLGLSDDLSDTVVRAHRAAAERSLLLHEALQERFQQQQQQQKDQQVSLSPSSSWTTALTAGYAQLDPLLAARYIAAFMAQQVEGQAAALRSGFVKDEQTAAAAPTTTSRAHKSDKIAVERRATEANRRRLVDLFGRLSATRRDPAPLPPPATTVPIPQTTRSSSNDVSITTATTASKNTETTPTSKTANTALHGSTAETGPQQQIIAAALEEAVAFNAAEMSMMVAAGLTKTIASSPTVASGNKNTTKRDQKEDNGEDDEEDRLDSLVIRQEMLRNMADVHDYSVLSSFCGGLDLIERVNQHAVVRGVTMNVLALVAGQQKENQKHRGNSSSRSTDTYDAATSALRDCPHHHSGGNQRPVDGASAHHAFNGHGYVRDIMSALYDGKPPPAYATTDDSNSNSGTSTNPSSPGREEEKELSESPSLSSSSSLHTLYSAALLIASIVQLPALPVSLASWCFVSIAAAAFESIRMAAPIVFAPSDGSAQEEDSTGISQYFSGAAIVGLLACGVFIVIHVGLVRQRSTGGYYQRHWPEEVGDDPAEMQKLFFSPSSSSSPATPKGGSKKDTLFSHLKRRIAAIFKTSSADNKKNSVDGANNNAEENSQLVGPLQRLLIAWAMPTGAWLPSAYHHVYGSSALFGPFNDDHIYWRPIGHFAFSLVITFILNGLPAIATASATSYLRTKTNYDGTDRANTSPRTSDDDRGLFFSFYAMANSCELRLLLVGFLFFLSGVVTVIRRPFRSPVTSFTSAAADVLLSLFCLLQVMRIRQQAAVVQQQPSSQSSLLSPSLDAAFFFVDSYLNVITATADTALLFETLKYLLVLLVLLVSIAQTIVGWLIYHIFERKLLRWWFCAEEEITEELLYATRHQTKASLLALQLLVMLTDVEEERLENTLRLWQTEWHCKKLKVKEKEQIDKMNAQEGKEEEVLPHLAPLTTSQRGRLQATARQRARRTLQHLLLPPGCGTVRDFDDVFGNNTTENIMHNQQQNKEEDTFAKRNNNEGLKCTRVHFYAHSISRSRDDLPSSSLSGPLSDSTDRFLDRLLLGRSQEGKEDADITTQQQQQQQEASTRPTTAGPALPTASPVPAASKSVKTTRLASNQKRPQINMDRVYGGAAANEINSNDHPACNLSSFELDNEDVLFLSRHDEPLVHAKTDNDACADPNMTKPRQQPRPPPPQNNNNFLAAASFYRAPLSARGASSNDRQATSGTSGGGVGIQHAHAQRTSRIKREDNSTTAAAEAQQPQESKTAVSRLTSVLQSALLSFRLGRKLDEDSAAEDSRQPPPAPQAAAAAAGGRTAPGRGSSSLDSIGTLVDSSSSSSSEHSDINDQTKKKYVKKNVKKNGKREETISSKDDDDDDAVLTFSSSSSSILSVLSSRSSSTSHDGERGRRSAASPVASSSSADDADDLLGKRDQQEAKAVYGKEEVLLNNERNEDDGAAAKMDTTTSSSHASAVNKKNKKLSAARFLVSPRVELTKTQSMLMALVGGPHTGGGGRKNNGYDSSGDDDNDTHRGGSSNSGGSLHFSDSASTSSSSSQSSHHDGEDGMAAAGSSPNNLLTPSHEQHVQHHHTPFGAFKARRRYNANSSNPDAFQNGGCEVSGGGSPASDNQDGPSMSKRKEEDALEVDSALLSTKTGGGDGFDILSTGEDGLRPLTSPRLPTSPAHAPRRRSSDEQNKNSNNSSQEVPVEGDEGPPNVRPFTPPPPPQSLLLSPTLVDHSRTRAADQGGTNKPEVDPLHLQTAIKSALRQSPAPPPAADVVAPSVDDPSCSVAAAPPADVSSASQILPVVFFTTLPPAVTATTAVDQSNPTGTGPTYAAIPATPHVHTVGVEGANAAGAGDHCDHPPVRSAPPPVPTTSTTGEAPATIRAAPHHNHHQQPTYEDVANVSFMSLSDSGIVQMPPRLTTAAGYDDDGDYDDESPTATTTTRHELQLQHHRQPHDLRQHPSSSLLSPSSAAAAAARRRREHLQHQRRLVGFDPLHFSDEDEDEDPVHRSSYNNFDANQNNNSKRDGGDDNDYYDDHEESDNDAAAEVHNFSFSVGDGFGGGVFGYEATSTATAHPASSTARTTLRTPNDDSSSAHDGSAHFDASNAHFDHDHHHDDDNGDDDGSSDSTNSKSERGGSGGGSNSNDDARSSSHVNDSVIQVEYLDV